MNEIARCGKFQMEIKPEMVAAGAQVISAALSDRGDPSLNELATQVFKAMFAEAKKK